ncbi:MAG: FAD-dependent oxidoreductase [Acidimicrobiia bacterium]|nr:FAD-dependent oxidoreductase [Acidimicrobiia bacterium]
MDIAVVGSGVSGLGAAWALARTHSVTLYEADDRPGGHAHTVDVAGFAVDTGFIVYNEATYPHFTRLLDALDVPTAPSDMSFSFSLDGDVEYRGSLGGMLAAPRNLLARRYRSMLRDIVRFRREGEMLLATAGTASLGEVLRSEGYSAGFAEDYLLPMAAAIWSARIGEIRAYPAASFLRFFANHGLIRITDRPRWRTVAGGSRTYVERIAAGLDDVRLSTPVRAVDRAGDGVTVVSDRGRDVFDHVVLATHTDQALRLLGTGASPEESAVLGAIRYEPNRAVLHSDPSLMPRRRRVWASWNYLADRGDRERRRASVTYWMNRLQPLDEAAPQLFVSLNPPRMPERVHGSWDYAHPQFDEAALSAQQRLADIQGRRRTWFAGAWAGYGFHEDGLQAGLNVAAALGSPAPWHDAVVPVSSAPAIGVPAA